MTLPVQKTHDKHASESFDSKSFREAFDRKLRASSPRREVELNELTKQQKQDFIRELFKNDQFFVDKRMLTPQQVWRVQLSGAWPHGSPSVLRQRKGSSASSTSLLKTLQIFISALQLGTEFSC